MQIIFLGIPVSGDVSEAQLKQVAVQVWLGQYRDGEGNLPGLTALKTLATAEINHRANEAVIQAGILTPQLFFAANVSDIAFLITEWRAAGRPTELDPEIYYRAITEAAAYAETSDPTMTPIKMLQTWEAQWNWMRGGFADLNYHRRLALERIKLAESAADIIEALAALPWGGQ